MSFCTIKILVPIKVRVRYWQCMQDETNEIDRKGYWSLFLLNMCGSPYLRAPMPLLLNSAFSKFFALREKIIGISGYGVEMGLRVFEICLKVTRLNEDWGGYLNQCDCYDWNIQGFQPIGFSPWILYAVNTCTNFTKQVKDKYQVIIFGHHFWF